VLQAAEAVEDALDAWNFVLGDDAGHQVDFHIIALDEHGHGIYGPLENGESYPAEALAGIGTVNGRNMACIAPEWLVSFHTGYDVDATDWADVSALCERVRHPGPQRVPVLSIARSGQLFQAIRLLCCRWAQSARASQSSWSTSGPGTVTIASDATRRHSPSEGPEERIVNSAVRAIRRELCRPGAADPDVAADPGAGKVAPTLRNVSQTQAVHAAR
jgi:hypothetical protein